ncbi:helix-turn-helix transcriptional regulator [Amycolatopsis sp. NPDC051716]|uniref:ArsR/SmtB family transcription factor n=1 Tax=Amycolatopsis sp. NPDC051716 TaxID=3155804 RepID=UPI0034175EBD
MTVRLFLARPLPGTVGETRRVVHVFEVPPEDTVPKRLTALCGSSFGRRELERLDHPKGMPCESCLRRTPTPEPTSVVVEEGRSIPLANISMDLEPLLLAPNRLFVVTLLSERQWCTYGFIGTALGITSPSLSRHLARLREAGIVETHKCGRGLQARLTREGSERLVNHLQALQAVVSRAAILVATAAWSDSQAAGSDA